MFDTTKPTLYLVRGVSGAGKSTFAATLANSLGIAYYEADAFLVNREGEYTFNPELLHTAHSVCQSWVKKDLSRGFSVVVSNTSTTEKEVKVYQDIAQQYEANFVSLIVENRNDTVSVHGVPEEVLQKQRNRFSVKL